MIKQFFCFLFYFLIACEPIWAACNNNNAGPSGEDVCYVVASGGATSGDCPSGTPCTLDYALVQAAATNLLRLANGSYGRSTYTDIPVGVSVTATNQTTPPSVRWYPTASIGSNYFVRMNSGSNTNGNQTFSYIELDGIDGANVAHYFLDIQKRNNVTFEHNYVHDFTGISGWTPTCRIWGNYVDSAWTHFPSDMQAPGTETNLDAAWATYMGTPITGISILNNDFYNCGDSDTDSLAPILNPLNIKDSIISENYMHADSIVTEFIQAVAGWFDNVEISKNKLHNPSVFTWRSTYTIEAWGWRKGCVIAYNDLKNGEMSLTVGKETDVYGNWIHYDSLNSLGYCVEFSVQTYGDAYWNYCSNTAYGIQLGDYTSKSFTVRDSDVYGNLIAPVRYFGIEIRSLPSSANVYNINVYNNTVNGQVHSSYGSFYLYKESGGADLHLINIKNNIASNGSGSSIALNTSMSDIVADTNNFYNIGAPYGISPTNTISGDPDFINPTEGDFRLGGSSASAGTGLELIGYQTLINWASSDYSGSYPVIVTGTNSSFDLGFTPVISAPPTSPAAYTGGIIQ